MSLTLTLSKLIILKLNALPIVPTLFVKGMELKGEQIPLKGLKLSDIIKMVGVPVPPRLEMYHQNNNATAGPGVLPMKLGSSSDALDIDGDKSKISSENTDARTSPVKLSLSDALEKDLSWSRLKSMIMINSKSSDDYDNIKHKFIANVNDSESRFKSAKSSFIAKLDDIDLFFIDKKLKLLQTKPWEFVIIDSDWCALESMINRKINILNDSIKELVISKDQLNVCLMKLIDGKSDDLDTNIRVMDGINELHREYQDCKARYNHLSAKFTNKSNKVELPGKEKFINQSFYMLEMEAQRSRTL